MMIVLGPTQDQIDRLAQELAPDVVRIRVRIGEDRSGYPAVYFRIVLSDEASRPERLAAVAAQVRAKLTESLQPSNSDLLPYFRFRSQSEQKHLKEEAWE